MHKMLGFVLPYIMIVLSIIMSMMDIVHKDVLEAFVLGILLSIWFICVAKAEGTVLMKLGFILSVVIEIVAIVLGFVNSNLTLLVNLMPLLTLLALLECMALYFVYQNKPRSSMTYRYSYKNKRRRYF